MRARPLHARFLALVVFKQRRVDLGRRGIDLRLQATAAEHTEQDLFAALAGLGGLRIVDQRQHTPLGTTGQFSVVLAGETAATDHERRRHGQTQATNGLHTVYSC
ncbi:hypothetical protein D3C80_1739700 [compost metagenome]